MRGAALLQVAPILCAAFQEGGPAHDAHRASKGLSQGAVQRRACLALLTRLPYNQSYLCSAQVWGMVVELSPWSNGLLLTLHLCSPDVRSQECPLMEGLDGWFRFLLCTCLSAQASPQACQHGV